MNCFILDWGELYIFKEMKKVFNLYFEHWSLKSKKEAQFNLSSSFT